MMIRRHFLLSPPLLAAWLALATHAPGQVILNTERFQLGDVSGTHGRIGLSLSGALGNVRLLDVASAGIVGHRGERHWPRVIAGGQFLADRERRVLNDRFAQLRYSYIFTPATESFHFVQYQANANLLLVSRWLVGGGVRAAVVAAEHTALHIGTGAMYEAERRDAGRLEPGEAVRPRTVRMANHAVLTRELPGDVRLVNILYFQPSVEAFSDMRLLNDLGLDVPLGDRVGLNFSASWRRDSRPPAGLRRDDLDFRTAVSVDF